jgi:hypothetical protein
VRTPKADPKVHWSSSYAWRADARYAAMVPKVRFCFQLSMIFCQDRLSFRRERVSICQDRLRTTRRKAERAFCLRWFRRLLRSTSRRSCPGPARGSGRRSSTTCSRTTTASCRTRTTTTPSLRRYCELHNNWPFSAFEPGLVAPFLYAA